MTHTHTNFEILSANRSENNESEAKEMAGCIADGDKVIAYFPTLSAMNNAKLLAASPDLLAALEGLLHGSRKVTSQEDWNAEREEASATARAAIAKATGKGEA